MCMNWDLPGVQSGFRKGKGTRDQIANICWIIGKAREFQLNYFKSWKMMLWKCCTQYASKFGKLSSGHRTGKGQFLFQSQRKTGSKNIQTITQLHSFQVLRLQQYENQELPDIQAGFRKGRGTRDQIANICWIIEKARKFQKKTSTSASLTMLKPLTVWITKQTVENSWRDGNTRPPYLPEKPVCRSRSNR